MKILLLNDTIISKNYGCQLVSHSIRKVLKEVYPSATITYQGMKSFSKSSEDYDKVIINGEGSFGHRFKLPGGFQRHMMGVIKHYIAIGTPTYLINCSIQATPDEILEHYETLSKLEVIGLREPISYMYCKKLGLTNIKLFPDLGTAYFEEETIANKTLDFCFGLGAITKMKDKIEKPLQNYINVINKIAEEGYKCAFLDFPSNPSSDLNIAGPRLHPAIKQITGGFEKYYDAVKTAKYNVTGRHHGMVMAFVGKTPSASFDSNMWKTEGDQMLYGPNGYFHFAANNEKELYSFIMENYANREVDTLKLNDKYTRLKPYFKGHIECTLDPNTQGMESMLNFDEIAKDFKELYYLEPKKYGLQ